MSLHEKMNLLDEENKIHLQGFKSIACMDECGRGPLFGWVVSAAVILPPGLLIEGVRDSKKVTPKGRDRLYDIIMEKAVAVGIGMADPPTIERINIKQASRLSMKLAVENLRNKEGNRIVPDFLLIDAETIDLDVPQKGIIKGDTLCHGIAAASIIAKVTRDRLCREWAESLKLPEEYRDVLVQSKGYGTAKHIACIMKYGYTILHRRSFLRNIRPLKEFPICKEQDSEVMNY